MSVGNHLLAQADARRIPLADKSVHMVCTSPPYFGLRDYNCPGQIGLEPTPDLFVAAMVAVFREIWRVLRDDGTAWLNLGSSFVSGTIESDRYVIRDDLTDQEYKHAIAQVTEAMSSLRQADEPAESTMSGVLAEGARKAGELFRSSVPEMQEGIHGAQDSCGARSGDLLFEGVREIGKPDPQKGNAVRPVLDMRQEVRQVQGQHSEEPRQQALLQPGMLVQLQSEGQPLPLGRRPAREDEPGRRDVAQVGPEEGPEALPPLPREQEAGGASHSPVRISSEDSVGCDQRNHALPRLPRKIPASRDGACGTSRVHRDDSSRRLEITLRKQDLPPGAIRYFRPTYTLKPKDDALIPHRVAMALQADGWYLRSDIIWSKPNPMPESVTDRPTKAHEYLFLLSKNERYFYDADAIREPLSETASYGGQYRAEGKQKAVGNGHAGLTALGRIIEPNPDGRNRRSVWTIATQPFPGSHFAVMPSALVEPCIKAGTSEHGVCPECGGHWERVVERGEKVLSGHPRGNGAAHCAERAVNGAALYRTLTEQRGWRPTCPCNAGPPVPAVVLDPFSGASTTGVVSLALGRSYIGLDLSRDYLTMAQRRIERPHAPVERAGNNGAALPLFAGMEGLA